jgi:hypothetical protein
MKIFHQILWNYFSKSKILNAREGGRPLALPKIKNLPKRPLKEVLSYFLKEYSVPIFLSRGFMIWAG